MSISPVRRRAAAALAVSAAAALVLSSCSSSSDGGGDSDSDGSATAPATGPSLPPPTSVTLPPEHAGFDYQISSPYQPPAGVQVVSRDHGAAPAAGMYNICYVNAFQAQSGAEKDWEPDLLLRDGGGKVVYDRNWNEALLDVRTDAKRQRIAQKVNGWIDECAAKGFNAVEPDNYDSYTRSDNLLTAADVEAFQTVIAAHAHEKMLAIGQKNTVELAGDRQKVGLDFAVAEECGEQDECGGYVDAFGDRVYVIEYTDKGLSKACKGWGDKLSIVRRDKNVLPQGKAGNVRKTC
ncbi:endo alpha-1,4 polygalactosaminidase [Kitasatospora sp. NPDC048722]|uniref:endo alpha-1,4 polygalactosaminidase n=1 Tax=Kitasatospora sp. NPDC048722 TaxID=3155639 RepID=UPI0033D57E0F